jgi:hypothetical protein
MLLKVRQYMPVIFVVLIGGGLIMTTGSATAEGTRTSIARTIAIQDIEYLRRLYARATDRIGENTPESISEGRATYHQIFTPDVFFQVKGDDTPAEDTIGPDAWVKVVVDALGPIDATQHLIGTQLVDIESLESDAAGNVIAGEASMTSYLQAWHARANGNVWLFIGSYYDKARYTAGVGWQIYDTTIERISGEERPMINEKINEEIE